MRLLMVILSTFLLFSCSQINRDSQEHYYQGRAIRHGIVPITLSVSKQNQNAPLNPQAVKRGQAVYEQNCLACHGAQGLGDGVEGRKLSGRPANLQKTVEKVPNFKFYMMISQWKGQMPGWKNMLSKKQLEDVGQYIRSLAR